MKEALVQPDEKKRAPFEENRMVDKRLFDKLATKTARLKKELWEVQRQNSRMKDELLMLRAQLQTLEELTAAKSHGNYEHGCPLLSLPVPRRALFQAEPVCKGSALQDIGTTKEDC